MSIKPQLYLPYFLVSALAAPILGCNSSSNSSVTSEPKLNSLLKGYSTSCTNLHCNPGIYFVKDATALTNIGETLENQQQQTDQFSNQHYAILVAPGTYDMVDSSNNPRAFNLGYYTQILGVGKSMEDVTINPGVEAYNQGGFLKGAPNCFGEGQNNTLCETLGGLNNFWRGEENFSIQNNRKTDANPPTSQVLIMAVSQAAPIRSIHFKGSDVLLCDYHTPGWGCGYTSGGFMANSIIDNKLSPGSQQQWLARNSNITKSETAAWNSVFVNDSVTPVIAGKITGPNQPSNNTWTNFPIAQTTSSITKEKPYLSCTTSCNNADDAIKWKVEVPQVRTNAIGVDTTTPTELDVDSQFFIVSPSLGRTVDNVTTLDVGPINAQLAAGKNLIITPGVYNLNGSLNITKNDTVILGLGLPDLVCTSGQSCMNITATSGVDLAGITFDAGYKLTPSLLQIGSSKTAGSAADPILLHDVFFRIAETQLDARVSGQERQTVAAAIIYTGNVIGDNLWIWRADHDKPSSHNMTDPTKNLVDWSQDLAQYGIEIYGDNVTMNGLAVEHFQNYQTVWYGNNGTVNFYQSEMPYDVPSLSTWTCTDPKSGTKSPIDTGCASYVIDNSVTSHTGNGLGIYTYFANNPIMAKSAFIVPDNLNGISLTHLVGKWLNGNTSSGYSNLVINQSANKCFGYGVKFESPSTYASSKDYSVLGAVNSSASASSNCN